MVVSPSKNSNTYKIKAYIIPLYVQGKQYVNISNIKISSNCFTKIKTDRLGNNYLLMICSGTRIPYARVSFLVKRTYDVPYSGDIGIYQNEEISPCVKQPVWCTYNHNYSLGVSRNGLNVTENVVEFYQYLKNNFKYNETYSQRYTSPKIVFSKMQGTCDEIAWLFEDIMKNIDIPARYVLGIYFSPNGSVLHAWDEVWINNSWYDIDILANELYYVDGNHVFLGFFPRPEPVVQCLDGTCNIISSKLVIRRFGGKCLTPQMILPFINVTRENKTYLKINLSVISRYPVIRRVFYNLSIDNAISLAQSSLTLKRGLNSKNIIIPISSSFIGGHYYIFSIYDQRTGKTYEAKDYFVVHRSPVLDITSCQLKSGKKGYYIVLNITNAGKGIAKNIVISVNLSKYEQSVFNFSNTTVYIDTLKPGQSKDVIFVFTTKLPILPSKSSWSFSISYENQDNVKEVSRFKILAINVPNKNDIIHIILLGLFLIGLILWAIIQLKSVI